jgi:hypothetical protein
MRSVFINTATFATNSSQVSYLLIVNGPSLEGRTGLEFLGWWPRPIGGGAVGSTYTENSSIISEASDIGTRRLEGGCPSLSSSALRLRLALLCEVTEESSRFLRS